MRLAEALQIASRAKTGERTLEVHLLCGFTPLHLDTFVKARLAMRFPEADVHVHTGLYGDVEGNIQRALASPGYGAILILEWSDFDQRLGYRASAGWRTEILEDVILQVQERCLRLESLAAELAEMTPLAVVGPSLALPPLTYLPPVQSSTWELRLNSILTEFLLHLSGHKGIRLVSQSALASCSTASSRHDLRMDLLAGAPYSLAHADAVAELSVECLFPAPSKKGLITDLDQTLWKGILGDAGPDGVSWSLEAKSQAYALYQQTLASLAESGVLIAVASKNDAGLVEAALRRPDLLLRASQVFPVEANWGVKSEAVSRILRIWNIAADAVVFVDDSPMELAEVSEKHPGIECIQFPSEDPDAIGRLLRQLRSRFGKIEVLDEDRLRLQSIRAGAHSGRETEEEGSRGFLARAEAKVTFQGANSDPRAFELVNKTNQFNLNGKRYAETEWRAMARRPGAFLATVSYEDRFGPLGKIAVMGGYLDGGVCHVDVWVMSCRAFSRQVEFQSIRQLFEKTRAAGIRFRFKPNDRNGPMQSFLAHFFPPDFGEGDLQLSAPEFNRRCPALFHQVDDKWTM